jgi:hypothetical protein
MMYGWLFWIDTRGDSLGVTGCPCKGVCRQGQFCFFGRRLTRVMGGCQGSECLALFGGASAEQHGHLDMFLDDLWMLDLGNKR